MKRKRHRDQPHKVLHLTTYQRLEQYLGAFSQGHFHLLILVGAGGFADDAKVEGGAITLSDRPGIGFEGQAALYGIMKELAA